MLSYLQMKCLKQEKQLEVSQGQKPASGSALLVFSPRPTFLLDGRWQRTGARTGGPRAPEPSPHLGRGGGGGQAGSGGCSRIPPLPAGRVLRRREVVVARRSQMLRTAQL